jgi:hypothetical protein
MSTEEVQSIVDIVMKPKQKTENRKILVVIICCLIPTVMLGIDIGKWEQWRNDIERRVTDLEHVKTQPVAHVGLKN